MTCKYCENRRVLGRGLVPQVGLKEEDGRVSIETYYLLNIIADSDFGLAMCEAKVPPEAINAAGKALKKEGIEDIPLKNIEPINYCPFCGASIQHEFDKSQEVVA